MDIGQYVISARCDRAMLAACGDKHGPASRCGSGTNMGPISARYYEAVAAINYWLQHRCLPQWAD